jgi:hypothetical protein
MNTIFVDGAARHSRTALAAALMLGFASTAAFADERCQQLEALARQYAGVTLTSVQQQMKRQMVAWYKQNCRTRRAAAGG